MRTMPAARGGQRQRAGEVRQHGGGEAGGRTRDIAGAKADPAEASGALGNYYAALDDGGDAPADRGLPPPARCGATSADAQPQSTAAAHPRGHPFASVVDPVLTRLVRSNAADFLEPGLRVRVRIVREPSPSGGKTRREVAWVPAVVQWDRAARGRGGAIHLQARSKKHVKRWIPTKPARFFGAPTLDVDIHRVHIVPESAFANTRRVEDELEAGARVAVRVFHNPVIAAPSAAPGRPRVLLAVDGQHTTPAAWVPGEVGELHGVYYDHGFREIRIEPTFVPWASFKAINGAHQQPRSLHRVFTDRPTGDVVCWGPLAVLPNAHGAEHDTAVMRNRTLSALAAVVGADFHTAPRSSGGWGGAGGNGHWWAVWHVESRHVKSVLETLRNDAPWCSAAAKSECELGFAPCVHDPADADASTRGSNDSAATAVRLRSKDDGDDDDNDGIAVLVPTIKRGAWTMPRHRAVELLTGNPRALDGCTLHFVGADSVPGLPLGPGVAHASAVVKAYLPHVGSLLLGVHSSQSSGSNGEPPLALVRLQDCPLRVDPTRMPVAPLSVVDSFKTRFAECVVCFDVKTKPQFADFCFANFRVSGDSSEMTSPRHPGTVCHDCLRSHASVALGSGQLFVPCPAEGCGRNLQTLELKKLVDARLYDKLVAGLRNVEVSGQRAFHSAEELAGLDLRACPKCAAAIEKNEGCGSMRCYRCGASFSWGHASPVKPTKGGTAGAAGARGGVASAASTGSVGGNAAAAAGHAAAGWRLRAVAGALSRRAVLIVPLTAVAAAVAWAYASNRQASALHVLNLAPLAEQAWARLPESLQNGTQTVLPWPNSFDAWVFAPYMASAAAIAGWVGGAFGVAHSAASAAALATLTLSLSPLCDGRDGRSSAASRVATAVAVGVAFAAVPLLSMASDRVWALGPAVAVKAGEFVLGHIVTVIQAVLFSGVAYTARVMTAFAALDIALDVHNKIRFAEARDGSEGSFMFWLEKRLIAPVFFGVTFAAIICVSCLAADHNVAIRRMVARVFCVWNEWVEPVVLYLDTSSGRPHLRGLVSLYLKVSGGPSIPASLSEEHSDTRLGDARPCGRLLDGAARVANDVLSPPRGYSGPRRWRSAVIATVVLAWVGLRSPAVFVAATAVTRIIAEAVMQG